MKFRYQARTKDGELQVGFVEAGSKELAEKILLSHDLFILLLEEVSKPNFFTRLIDYFNRVRLKDLVIFYRQIATLFEAHLSLSRSLETLYSQTKNPQLKEAIFEVLEDIQAGLSFSQAIEKQKNVFSEFAISLIKSAEVTGNLDRAMSFLAEYTEKEYALISKARSAMIYPIILILAFIGVSIVMVTNVFPQIQPIFEQSGVNLPFFAKILLGVSNFIINWWFFVLIFLGIAFILILDFIQTDEGKALIDEIKVRAPGFRRVFLPIIISRFSNALVLLLRGGVPVAQSVEVLANTIDNAVYRELFYQIANDVKSGMNLSEAISNYPDRYFPSIIPQMIAVGENTGQLDRVLEKIANFYAQEADNVVGSLSELIQPILIIGIGILIAFLFASILIPIYNLTATFGNT